MKSFKLWVLPILVIFALAFSLSSQAGDEPSSCDGLKVATGPAGKGYSKLFADMQSVCGKQVPMCEVRTSGGLDNLNSLSVNEADVGLVQVDTYNDMKRGDENIASLKAVMPLNYNYLHIVTNSSGASSGRNWYGTKKYIVVNNFADLRSQKVAVVGSTKLLARRLNQQLNMNMQFVEVDTDAQAFGLVKDGSVAAAMTVSGWPSGTVNQLKQDSGLTLVPFNMQVQAPYVTRTVNYRNLGVYNLNTLAVPNMLITRPFKGTRANDVVKLRNCLVNNLQNLQEGSYQPGWKEVKDTKSTYDIPSFTPGK